MSNIKNFLHQIEEEEQEELMVYLEWAEENKELFQKLVRTTEEVIGYEE
jgi:uncharacterized protein YjgD (DUF1641 family)